MPFLGMDNVEAHSMRILGSVPAVAMKSLAVWFEPGDVLYGRLRPYLNKVVSPRFKGLASAEFLPLTPEDGVLGDFVRLRLNAADFVLFASHLDEGDRPRVDWAGVSKFSFSLPPTNEQQRIVDAIESYLTRLDDAAASLERARAKLKTYRASVLNAAVTGRLVPTEASLARAEVRDYEPAQTLLDRILVQRRRRWEEAQLARMKEAGKVPKDDAWKRRYVEPAKADASSLPTLPEGWCWATLPQLGELNRGKSRHRPRNDPKLLGGPYPLIQTGEIRRADTWIRTNDQTYSEFGLAQSRLWPVGTLCITIAANIAETAILAIEACFPDSVVGFLHDDAALTRYVELFFRTARERLASYAPATAQKNINLDTLEKVAIPLPPAAEQRRLVEKLDEILSLASNGDASIQRDALRIARLRQSILKWAFEGRLVDQDPSDEPAEALLARIRAAREATPSPRKTRGRTAKRTT